MLKNYAMEEATPDGHPTGDFYFNYSAAMMGAQEVVETHLNKKGKDNKAFLDKKFNETWEHYDVNNDGVMDAMWASPFMRSLCKSEKDIDLQ